MTTPSFRARQLVLAAAASLMTMPTPLHATSLSGFAPPSELAADSRKDATVKRYSTECLGKASANSSCDTLRKEAIDILKEDVLTLGSSANREFLPTLLKVSRSDAPELRIAVLDAIGMIGPKASDLPLLARLANDPVPDVRQAAGQAISRGKGEALALLSQRIMSSQATGLTPDSPPDARTLAMPVAPESTYLFYGSDQSSGHLSYVTNNLAAAGSFYKAKTKKGPLKLEEFQELYRYQLQDEEHALDQAHNAAAEQLEQTQPPDPTNTQAFMEYLQKTQSVINGRMSVTARHSFEPTLFGNPTVYVLEERQIGQRRYPTRYVVLYQDVALNRPGYRLSWMTVPDEAIKAAQATSFAEEKEERARKGEEEALKKKEAAMDALTKKKDAAEKKKFKKGQEDLEKALGF